MLTPCTHITSSVPDLIQATFNSYHGVSAAPFASLNGSFGVGDCADKVQANRNRMKQALGINRLISARQVHGDQIFRLGETPDSDQELDGIDALMTDRRGVGLMIQHADCQAILLHDPVQSAIAAVHCGWRGSVIRIIEKTVEMMNSCYQSRPEDIAASISPSLGPCCSEFINHRQELPTSFQAFQTRSNYFDFWQISRFQLMEVGLHPEKISVAGICTSCSPDFFSYRRAIRQGNGITGRNCTIISLTATHK
ncbi:MAG: peptidoglycan editing factor PgeF [Proteobacteria bacterium]|nr:peptidoglycan editing factor PgeF [Pseudomonadota bacterium]MBU1648575.1 peptidoglycan editing factor PgeF [Pseudomonadota bacterium]MBU1986526.1 peptidoglycan editing factor PgeF [Pseudomonadota bacterium]